MVRLDGHILPGASGAPLITADGRVAAIGSGGLRNGAASISWAVPAGHLKALLVSREQLGAIASGTSGLFTVPFLERSMDSIRCGTIEFVPIGVRAFVELSTTADDPRGLNQILAGAALPLPSLEQFRYIIYAPLDRGAAIAIPTWMRVESRETFCLATSLNGRLTVEFGGARVGDIFAVQSASMDFEMQFVQRSGRQWVPDLSASYMAPLPRLDGLVVRRKGFFSNDPSAPPAWAFETLMVKGDTFAGAIMVNHRYDPQRIQFCRFQPHAPACQSIGDEIASIAQTVLGVHLSTFPVH